MKKYIIPVILLISLTGCSEEYYRQQEHNRAMELERIKQRTIQIQEYTKQQASRTPEQVALDEQAKSLKYLENSKKVHDTIEVIRIGCALLGC